MFNAFLLLKFPQTIYLFLKLHIFKESSRSHESILVILDRSRTKRSQFLSQILPGGLILDLRQLCLRITI